MVTAQSGFASATAAGEARAAERADGRAAAAAAAFARLRAAIVDQVLHGLWRYVALGLAVGALLVLLGPLIAAAVALVVSAAGIVLSEGRMHGADTRVLLTGAGLMLPAIAYLVVEVVRLV